MRAIVILCLFLLPAPASAQALAVITSFPSRMTEAYAELWAKVRPASQIRGTNQAICNALDAQALIDTVEGAHKEVENILQRMREVAVQSANDTNSTQDRNNLIVEFIALEDEIDRIAETTTWAGQSLLNANDRQSAGAGTILNELAAADTTADFTFQIGSGTSDKDRIAVSIR